MYSIKFIRHPLILYEKKPTWALAHSARPRERAIKDNGSFNRFTNCQILKTSKLADRIRFLGGRSGEPDSKGTASTDAFKSPPASATFV